MKDEVDPFMVEVSLHGATAETHDRQTQVPGSFARLTMNLREARALGLRIKLNSPLTLWNEREVVAMYALADDLGLPIQFDALITRRDNGDASPQRISPSARGSRASMGRSGIGMPARRPAHAIRCDESGRVSWSRLLHPAARSIAARDRRR
jgi:molybdenum cofactor biosynthesis enzyme MoaA